jgi:hypothetical protein
MPVRARMCPDVLGLRHQLASSSTARRTGLALLNGIADSHPLGGIVSWLVLDPKLCQDSRS